jgi:O-antigen/teichoic acid export membrane protein
VSTFAAAVRTRFVKDAFVLQVALAFQAATYLLTSVLTKRYLGLEDMGRWVSAREMFTLAYFFVSTGIVNATVSRYSEAIGRQDRKLCVDVLAAMLKIGGLSSIVVLALGFAFGPWAGEYWYQDRVVGEFTAILCNSGLFEVVRGITVAALQGTRQMRAFAWFEITTTTLRVGVVWGALAAGLGLPGVVGAFLVHMLLAGAVALVFYARARRGDAKVAPPPLREVLAAVPRAPLRHVSGIGYLIALNKSMNTLVPRFGMLLIPALGMALGSQAEAFEDNAAYSIGWVLSWGLGLAVGGVAQTLLPALGLKLGSTGVPFDQLGGYLRRISLATGAFMAVATVLFTPVAWLIIRYGYGSDASRAFPFFLWLASGNLLIGFTVVVESFYIYSGKLKQAVLWNFVLAIIALAGIVLGGRFYGSMGVAAAAGLCRGVGLFHLVYIGFYFRRARGRSRHATQHPQGLPDD